MTAFLFLTTVLIWGTTFYAISLQLGDVPELQSVFYRFAIAAVIMWILVLVKKIRIRYSGSDHVLFAILGLFMFSLNYVVVYFATDHLVSGLVSVIFSLIIPFNILFYWLIFHEKPSLSLVVGSLFSIVGITALFIEDFYGITISKSVILGIGLALLSTILASAGNIIAQLLKLRNINVASCNTWGMSYGTLFLLIAVIFAGEPWKFSLENDYIFSLLYLSLAGTVIAFWTYLTLLHRIGAPRAAYITVIFPLVALLVSTLYEDMQCTGYKFLGVALIIAGNVFIIQRKQSVEN